MKNKFISLVLCLIVFLVPLEVFATETAPSTKGTLTLTYSKEGVSFADLDIKIHRIAEIADDGTFKKLSPYDSYPISLTDISSQIEWAEIATTFRGYIQADAIEPYMVQKTDAEGNAVFSDIEKGLYLIEGLSVQENNYVYTFFDFMMTMPDSEGNNIITAKPKSDMNELTYKKNTYSVMNLWQDEGHSQNRPHSVSVDILKDGKVSDSVILNSTNNWRYTFETSDYESVFSVVERNVPKDYTVKITEKGTDFVIVNTLDKKDDSSSDTSTMQTGDTSSMRFYMILFSIAGFALIILGFAMRRKDDAQQK